MATYGQFCPVAIACEVLTERWTPLIIREFLCGTRRFNDLRRGVPLMSPSLLSKRLKMLERAGVVQRSKGSGGVEYRLTPAGEELRPLIESIGAWGQRWARGQLDPARLDASLLMWDVQRNVVTDQLPPRRVVVHFQLEGSIDKKSHFWLVLDRPSIDLCLADPGYEADLYVQAHLRTVVRYWMGLAEIGELVRSGELMLEGPRPLVRAFPTWFRRSIFVSVVPGVT